MRLALSLLCLWTLCPAVLAGGLDPRRVPAEARWVTHIDLEALNRSKFLGALAEQGEDFTREFDLDRVQPMFGVDPRKDLLALTFFNSSKDEREFAIIVEARASIEVPWSRLIERSRDVRRIGARNVYGVGTDMSLFAASMNESRSQTRLFLLATSESAMSTAMHVLDGVAPSLGDSPSSGITARPSTGAIVFSAGSTKARGSPFMGRAIRLLREFAALDRAESDAVELNAQGLVFEFAEDRDDMCLRLDFETPAAKNAAEIEQVLRTALARVPKLAAGSDAIPQIDRLTAAVRITSEAARVRTSFRYGAAAFVTDVLRSERMMGVTKTH